MVYFKIEYRELFDYCELNHKEHNGHKDFTKLYRRRFVFL